MKRHPGLKLADFWYQCAEWNRTRRLVTIRQLMRTEKRLLDIPVHEYFCYVTIEQVRPMEAHCSYGKMAICETWVEECERQMNAGHVLTREFLANAVLFQCVILAYNPLRWIAMLAG